MKWKILMLLVVVTVSVACNKNKFNTRPSLTLKSVSSYVVPVNGTLTIEFEFTDKEGDISNLLYLKKIRTNKRAVPTLRDTLSLPVPDFPKNDLGVIRTNLDYQTYLVSAQNPPKVGNPPVNESDSLTLKFALKDKANNVSDTVTINGIVIMR
jgi:hypothetical protein